MTETIFIGNCLASGLNSKSFGCIISRPLSLIDVNKDNPSSLVLDWYALIPS